MGSCHSFVVASIYEEKLKREGMASDLSEKDLFLRVYFRGLDEEQEILRQLTMSVDRQLPWTFREGATLDRVAAEVKKYGVLSTAEDPYARKFKAGLPMYMNQLRSARMTVHRKASEMKSRLGRSLTRAEKSAIVQEQLVMLKSNGAIDALRIKQGNRASVRNFAGNFVYKQVNARQSPSKLPHVVKLLEQGSVGAGLVQYPWAGGAKRATSGHAVVLRDYDPQTNEFVVTNPWWLGSFGYKRHDRIDANEFMRYLDTYGWLQDTRPIAMRKTGPTEVAAARIAKGNRAAGRRTASSKPSGTGFFAKLFNKPAAKPDAEPDVKVAKVKKPIVDVKKAAAVASVDQPAKKGLLWKLFGKKQAAVTVAKTKQSPAPKAKQRPVAQVEKPVAEVAEKPKKKGFLSGLFSKPPKKKKNIQRAKPRNVTKPTAQKQEPAAAQPKKKGKGLFHKWFKKNPKS